jgi:polyisoprenoid-binding protein YceI
VHGRHREHVAEVPVTDRGDASSVASRTEVRQSDFGIARYSMVMGA